jgi:hypothetical protein
MNCDELYPKPREIASLKHPIVDYFFEKSCVLGCRRWRGRESSAREGTPSSPGGERGDSERLSPSGRGRPDSLKEAGVNGEGTFLNSPIPTNPSGQVVPCGYTDDRSEPPVRTLPILPRVRFSENAFFMRGHQTGEICSKFLYMAFRDCGAGQSIFAIRMASPR